MFTLKSLKSKWMPMAHHNFHVKPIQYQVYGEDPSFHGQVLSLDHAMGQKLIIFAALL